MACGVTNRRSSEIVRACQPWYLHTRLPVGRAAHRSRTHCAVRDKCLRPPFNLGVGFANKMPGSATRRLRCKRDVRARCCCRYCHVLHRNTVAFQGLFSPLPSRLVGVVRHLPLLQHKPPLLPLISSQQIHHLTFLREVSRDDRRSVSAAAASSRFRGVCRPDA